MFQNQAPEKIVRYLIRSRDRAALATIMRDSGGEPYVSLTLNACDYQGRPLIFISNLAEHTKNIRTDSRSSLLFEATDGLLDPLSGPRATVQGEWVEINDPTLRERFFRRHESARRYEQAHDFFLFRMNIRRAHLVAGFGRIHWIDGANILYKENGTATLEAHELRIVEHMNNDHQDALDLYANVLVSAPGNGWKMIGIDSEGFDLRLNDKVIRWEFDSPVSDAEQVREKLVNLVKQARSY